LHRLSKPHIEAALGKLAPDPTPARRRLDRNRHDPATPLLGPTAQTVAVSREALLDHLAALRIEHRRLKDVLVDVNRRAHHHGPPLVDRGPIVLSPQDRAL